MAAEPKVNSKRYAMAKEALRRINLLPKDLELANTYIRLAADVFKEKKGSPTNEFQNKYGNHPSLLILMNVAVLKLAFGFETKHVEHAMMGEQGDLKKAIRLRAHDIAQRADAYGQARDKFSKLEEVLTSGRPFEAIDLFAELLVQPQETETQIVDSALPAIPLYMVQQREKALESEAYEAREPDALCLAAEHFATLGDNKRAWELIEEVFATTPDHPGAWTQKARVLLQQAKEGRRAAARFRMLSEEGEALSATEAHFEEMAESEFLSARELRRQAFDACLKAFSLLPAGALYEKAALNWSHDYGTLRQLRCRILEFIVREAGEFCNPYWESSELYERIEARLGRTRDIVFPPRPEYTGHDFEYVESPEKMARLSALPLFSESSDRMLLLAYEELKKFPLIEDTVGLQLLALNFLRVLAPADVYQREAQEFADNLTWSNPHTAGWYFGGFPGHNDPGDRRKVLHEHLSSVMSPAEQRDFISHIYDRWQIDVKKRQQLAVLSVYDEEVRSHFAAGKILESYEVACKGEAEGVYRRNDGWGALTLTRLAQHAATVLGGNNSSESVRQHLADTAMRDLAEDWYEDYYQNQPDDEEGIPFTIHLEAYLNRQPCE